MELYLFSGWVIRDTEFRKLKLTGNNFKITANSFPRNEPLSRITRTPSRTQQLS